MKLRIRELREKHNYTQKKIADFLICDQSLYSKYEREEREIPLHLIILLADLYKVDIDYIVGRKKDNKEIKYEK